MQILVGEQFRSNGIEITDSNKLHKVIELVKDRCTLLNDFVQQGAFFFNSPSQFDTASIKTKWDAVKNMFFIELAKAYESSIVWERADLEKELKELAVFELLEDAANDTSFCRYSVELHNQI